MFAILENLSGAFATGIRSLKDKEFRRKPHINQRFWGWFSFLKIQ